MPIQHAGRAAWSSSSTNQATPLPEKATRSRFYLHEAIAFSPATSRSKIDRGDRVMHAMTPRMQRTMERASAIAHENGQRVVGTEHVLLAFLEDMNGIAGGTLHRLGYADAVRAAVRRILASDSIGRRAMPSRTTRHRATLNDRRAWRATTEQAV
jgi:ATP-dependent Clp protease ATP-binding subunit ClpA